MGSDFNKVHLEADSSVDRHFNRLLASHAVPRAYRCRLALTSSKRKHDMFDYIATWLALKNDRRAVTALEYALIAGVIVAVIAVGFNSLAGDISSKFDSIGSSL